MKRIDGNYSGKGRSIGILLSKFNSFVTDKLLDGALDALARHGVNDDNITIIRVPGAFEIPLALNRAIESDSFDGIITLGAVIRGETPHFEYVAAETTKGVAHLALKAKIPVSFGVLTTDTVEQAIDRAGAKAGNKGFDAAMSLLEMIDLFHKI
ncbi:6,7-dimethyl-8-ribityllumazine synthase [Candidatus Calescamantes bacterium]|nr:6,7-dimethyl-8-ribityllumazine synthase [bacterium]MCK5223244.1 6,7-dimethyl-8-ribityllumazine synthase [Candidatus Calescamantes bacterium]MCK5598617.1 6,7-dimethyl-8-ribityllumazine synthase [bacterium]